MPRKPVREGGHPSASTAHAKKATLGKTGGGISHLPITSLRFKRIVAETSDAALESGDPKGKVAISVGFTQPKASVEKDFVAVTSTFKFRVTASQEEGAPAIATIDATVEITYSRPDKGKGDESKVKEFALANAPFYAWPYWREVVQSALTRLSLPVFRLPLVYASDLRQFTIPDDGTSSTASVKS